MRDGFLAADQVFASDRCDSVSNDACIAMSIA